MTDFIGSPAAIAAQKNIRDRQAQTALTPAWVNAARIMAFLEPDKTGWDAIKQIAAQDRMVGFPLVNADEMRAGIRQNLGPEWDTRAWDALTGSADQVLAACKTVTAAAPLPEDSTVIYHDRPSDVEITEIQTLNAATGVSPYPAYFMRSEAVPVLTVAIKDARNRVVATASATMRYHPDCTLGRYVFAGMVSVTPALRGKGLGKLANALVLRESHRRFNWTHATENVASDNPVSLAMITSCGLTAGGLVTVVASTTGENLTR